MVAHLQGLGKVRRALDHLCEALASHPKLACQFCAANHLHVCRFSWLWFGICLGGFCQLLLCQALHCLSSVLRQSVATYLHSQPVTVDGVHLLHFDGFGKAPKQVTQVANQVRAIGCPCYGSSQQAGRVPRFSVRGPICMSIQYKKYDNPCLCLFILLVVFTVHVEVASLNTSGFHTLGFTLVTLLV